MWCVNAGSEPIASKFIKQQLERVQTSNVKGDKKTPYSSREARTKSVCRADHER